MTLSGRKVLYFLVLSAIPFFLWIVPNDKVHLITLLSILLLYLVSRYAPVISALHETLEIVLLFVTLSFLMNQIGLDRFMPANIVPIIILMYLFLLGLKKHSRTGLFLSNGNNKGTFKIIVLFTLLSIVSLAVWFIFQTQNPHAKFIPNLPAPILIPLGIGFAIINAIYEEGIFRSILLAHFSDEIGFTFAIILQSIWFSFLHFQSGFPSGIIGIGLTFVFGVMMGYLVYRTRSILSPVIIHALTDFSIFVLIILRMNHRI
jgi:membrane protease YdiL (CAAX protease family)